MEGPASVERRHHIRRLCVAERVRLTNALEAQVDREKITGYLLQVDHPNGRSKAEFFARFGFNLENWRSLMVALGQHGSNCPAVETVESPYGARYVVEGELETPDGRNPQLRLARITEVGHTTLRLITAYSARSQHA